MIEFSRRGVLGGLAARERRRRVEVGRGSAWPLCEISRIGAVAKTVDAQELCCAAGEAHGELYDDVGSEEGCGGPGKSSSQACRNEIGNGGH